jgi:hypothetical protein
MDGSPGLVREATLPIPTELDLRQVNAQCAERLLSCTRRRRIVCDPVRDCLGVAAA